MSFLPPSPTLMNQAPLIADFTLSGPIVGPYRRGSDSSGQTLGEEEWWWWGGEGVGSISSKKTCQQNKILTNDRKDREIPPPFPSQTPGQPSVLGRWRHHLSRLAFLQCRLRRNQPVHRLTVLILTLIQRNSSSSPRLPLSFRTTHNSKSTTRSSCSAFRRDLFQRAAALSVALYNNRLVIILCYRLF